MVHNYSTYVNHGCRCDVCRKSNADYNRRARRRRRDLPLPDSQSHGVAATYDNYGCRCAECRSAHAKQAREWRAKRRTDADR